MKLLHLLLAPFADAVVREQLEATRAECEAVKRTLLTVDRSVERSQQHLLRRVEVQDRELERLRARLCEAVATIDDLTRWKREALLVIEQWEQVWDALGQPGRLGESKAASVLAVVEGESHE